MRLLSARLIISLVIGVTLVSLCSSYYQSYMLAQGMRRDLEHRAQLLGESVSRTHHGLSSAVGTCTPSMKLSASLKRFG